MKIYLEMILLGEIEPYRRGPGEFFPRLVGVSVSSDGNLTPLYIPAIRIQRRAGQLLIEINGDRPLAYITLQKKAPFINVFTFNWGLIDDEA